MAPTRLALADLVFLSLGGGAGGKVRPLSDGDRNRPMTETPIAADPDPSNPWIWVGAIVDHKQWDNPY